MTETDSTEPTATIEEQPIKQRKPFEYKMDKDPAFLAYLERCRTVLRAEHLERISTPEYQAMLQEKQERARLEAEAQAAAQALIDAQAIKPKNTPTVKRKGCKRGGK